MPKKEPTKPMWVPVSESLKRKLDRIRVTEHRVSISNTILALVMEAMEAREARQRNRSEAA